MTTLHAHTPSRLLTTARRGLWVRPGPPPNRLAAATVAATATGFAAVAGTSHRITRAYCRSVAVPHFCDTSNWEMQRLVLCNCVSLLSLSRDFFFTRKHSKKLRDLLQAVVVQIKTKTSFRFEEDNDNDVTFHFVRSEFCFNKNLLLDETSLNRMNAFTSINDLIELYSRSWYRKIGIYDFITIDNRREKASSVS